MNTKIFNNIDTLIDMATLSKSKEEINAELIEVNSLIESKKKEIEAKKQDIAEEDYVNTSLELVDKNIEVSLEQKVAKLNRQLKELENKNIELKENEDSLNKEIRALEENSEDNQEYLKLLGDRVSTSKDLTSLIKSEEDHAKHQATILKNKKKEYEQVLKELELNFQAKEELEAKLEEYTKRLSDIKSNLKNPNTYINKEQKEKDEQSLEELNQSLEELEKRKLILLCDASIIGMDAKELVLKKNYKEAQAKIKELLTIVKAKPFMDIKDNKTLETTLEKKENERRELVTLMANKNYELSLNTSFQIRLDYLQEEITALDYQINDKETTLKQIDDYLNNRLASDIRTCEEDIEVLEDFVANLKQLDTKDSETLKTLEKKEQELTTLKTILANYKDDLKDVLKKYQNIKELIEQLTIKKDNYLTEMNNLKDYQNTDVKVIDIIKRKEDEDRLKAINEDIQNIKARLAYGDSPDDIFDLIVAEMGETSKTNVGNKIESLDEPLDDSLSLETDTLTDTLEDALKEDIPQENLSSVESLDDNNSNVFKVIDIQPIEELRG